jgi:Xaa-Pro aminopeptidase
VVSGILLGGSQEAGVILARPGEPSPDHVLVHAGRHVGMVTTKKTRVLHDSEPTPQLRFLEDAALQFQIKRAVNGQAPTW